MKRFAPFLIIGLVAVLTLVGMKILLQANARTLSANSTKAPAAGTAPLGLGHARGPADARVTLEEFGDFQCPACAETSAVIDSLQQMYGDRLRLVFWQFPLAMHAHAREAAIAAEAAAAQGRFWEMHDLLYREQTTWAFSSDVMAEFEKLALAAHLNIALFQRELRSPEAAARVAREREYGVSRGVKNTPTLFLNGREIPPAFSPEQLREAINAAVAAGKTSPSHD